MATVDPVEPAEPSLNSKAPSPAHRNVGRSDGSPLSDVVRNELELVENVWRLPGSVAFGYSDGDAEEVYVHEVIRRATDISSRSRELEQWIVDWPSRYHLSRSRALAYWPMRFSAGQRVLEVGAGCGSITRYLGEQGCQVVALEASLRRARITRERTRDLPNVHVLCAPFQSIEFRARFDVIVCNGVFEYSAVFVSGDRPYESIIDHFRAALAPGGTLVIAIENQFGLRYFCSSAEDHNGVRFDGVEGYPRSPRGARTFSKPALEALIRRQFSQVEWLFPLSDYKLPGAVIRERLTERVPCGELWSAIPTVRHEAQRNPLFHENLAWHDIVNSGLASVFSNSLIALCHDGDSRLIDPRWLGSVYSINRRPRFTTGTHFLESPDGAEVLVEKSHLEAASDLPRTAGRVRHVLGGGTNWIEGVSVKTAVSRALCQPTPPSVAARIRDPLVQWWMAVVGGAPSSRSVPGSRLDAIWGNTILARDGVRIIDSEWAADDDLPTAWLICRAVRQFVIAELPFSGAWASDAQSMSEWQFAKTVAKVCGRTLSFSDARAAASLELDFQWSIEGTRRSALRRAYDTFVFFALSIRTRRRSTAWSAYWNQRVGRAQTRLRHRWARRDTRRTVPEGRR